MAKLRLIDSPAGGAKTGKKGDCQMNCGREIKYPKHNLCATCYGSIRVWSANKTDEERAARLVTLALYQARLNALDDGLVRIEHIKETARGKTHQASTKNSPRRGLRRQRSVPRLAGVH